MNDKRFLKELTKEELKKVLEVNKKLEDEVFESWCQNCMDMQEVDGSFLNLQGVKYHDDYDSFFHTLTEYRKFIENLNSEILGEKAQQKHKECEDMLNELYAMGTLDDGFDELEEKIEVKAKSLLKDVDIFLHYYEKMQYNKEEMLDWLDDQIKSFDEYEGVYVDENYKAYEHICYHVDYVKTY